MKDGIVFYTFIGRFQKFEMYRVFLSRQRVFFFRTEFKQRVGRKSFVFCLKKLHNFIYYFYSRIEIYHQYNKPSRMARRYIRYYYYYFILKLYGSAGLSGSTNSNAPPPPPSRLLQRAHNII